MLPSGCPCLHIQHPGRAVFILAVFTGMDAGHQERLHLVGIKELVEQDRKIHFIQVLTVIDQKKGKIFRVRNIFWKVQVYQHMTFQVP